MNSNRKVLVLAECAIYVAMAVVLSLFTLFRMPLGGSVTPFATLPIIIASLRHGSKWGIATALVFSLTQLLLGVSSIVAVPAKTLYAMVICAVLDYIIPYSMLGFSGGIAKRFDRAVPGIVASVLITGVMRLACSFLSGVLIWGVYAPEGWSVAYYSLIYNATWCGPDVGITLVVCVLLTRVKALRLAPERSAVNL